MGSASYLSFVQIVVVALLQLASFCAFIRILFTTIRKKAAVKELSTIVKFFVAYWALVTGPASAHNTYMIAWWRYNENIYSKEAIFWTAVWDRSAYGGVQVAVMFLTIDRCLTLWRGPVHDEYAKRYVAAMSILASLVVASLTFYGFASLPYKIEPECRAFGCVLQGTNLYLYYARIVFGVLNLCFAVSFAVLLRRYNKQRTTAWTETSGKSVGNNLVKYTLALEMFLLAFYVSIIVVGMISQIDIWLRFGALGRTAGAVESICCAMIYLKLLKTKFCCNSVSATAVTASTSVPRPPRSVQNK